MNSLNSECDQVGSIYWITWSLVNVGWKFDVLIVKFVCVIHSWPFIFVYSEVNNFLHQIIIYSQNTLLIPKGNGKKYPKSKNGDESIISACSATLSLTAAILSAERTLAIWWPANRIIINIFKSICGHKKSIYIAFN